MSRNLMSLRRVGTLVLLAAVLTIAGCSDNSVLGPDQNETIGLSRVSPFTSATTMAVLPDVAENVVEAAMAIDAQAGGVIPIDRGDYHHVFAVEPGGLDSDAGIDVKSKKEKVKDRDAITFEFGPDGLVFAKASKLRFDMAELNPDARIAKLYYFDPKAGDWVLQAEELVNIGVVVTFDIYHFSKYAISD